VQVFAPFVAAGFVEFVYGGADVGRYCNHHQLVDSVHLTGSEATYNNIVFGSPTVQVRVCIARIGGGCGGGGREGGRGAYNNIMMVFGTANMVLGPNHAGEGTEGCRGWGSGEGRG
jgi:hypothetical protein